METSIFYISFPLFLIATVLSVLFNMHMFQLNSYKVETQIKWLSTHKSPLFAGGILIALPVLSIVTYKVPVFNIILYIAIFLMLIITALINIPKKAKKPLVYTTRVIRMLVTLGIMTTLSSIGAFYAPAPYGVLILCVFCAFIPQFIMLSNLINSPAEAAVRKHYINDAKRILKSCPDLLTIGITGSYGKTSMKFYLGALLRVKYSTLITPENYNTPMGVVKTIRGSLRATHEVFVCEMGAKYTGDIKELCDIVHPTHGIITSIGEQHLETFHSLNNIIKTKLELADALPGDGMLFLNIDDNTIAANLPKRGFITYGTKENADFYAYDICVSRSGTEFTIRTPDSEQCRFTTRLIGNHNVINLLGAIAMASSLNIPLSSLVPYVKKLEAVPHRLQLIEHPYITIIDDAYNSNPQGCLAALSTLALFPDCKILVTPGMVELGALEDECNAQFGRQAAAVCDYVVLVGEGQTAAIRQGLDDAGYPQEKIYTAASLRAALDYVYSIKTQQRKIVLLENDLPDNY